MSVLVDSNVLFDLVLDDQAWADWSAEKVCDIGGHELLIINPIILAEVSLAFTTYEELEAVFPRDSFVREDLPWEAAFLAGRCFVEYKRRLGARRSPMPDFYIGAHASVRGHGLLTRDADRYRTYFPNLRLITPA